MMLIQMANLQLHYNILACDMFDIFAKITPNP